MTSLICIAPKTQSIKTIKLLPIRMARMAFPMGKALAGCFSFIYLFIYLCKALMQRDFLEVQRLELG
jgi:hypothetical protein